MEVTNNTRQHQFEVLVEDQQAELVYRLRGNTFFLLHTYVPEEINGRGIASLLAKTALEFARDQGHKIGVLCPFVAAYVERHPEWYALYDEEYHQKIPRD